ncbi:MAG: hypothetical protein QXI58_00605 [Candidatus Micrarchaeia archaeon]
MNELKKEIIEELKKEFKWLIDVDASEKNLRVKIRTSSWDGVKEYWVSEDDLREFYQNFNILSGLQQLGPILGDWRAMRDLAESLRFIFEEIREIKRRKDE